jgi:pre-mRNA-splicing factor 38B
MFNPSPVGTPESKEVTIGDFIRDIILTHNYFETLLPRFPEPIKRSWLGKFAEMGIPTKSLGNGGQGGFDRRGIDEPNKRPASVKASLSVGFKQRAPNRKNAYESTDERLRNEVKHNEDKIERLNTKETHSDKEYRNSKLRHRSR